MLNCIFLQLLCFGLFVGICQSQELSDMQLGTIHGQVTDEDNNPLSGYTVSAISQTDSITYATKTNSGGEFTLTNLPAGDWKVKLRYYSTVITERDVTTAGEAGVKTDFMVAGTGVIFGFLLDSINKFPLPITGEIQVGLLENERERIAGVYRGKVFDGYFEVKGLLPGRYRLIDAFDGYVFALTDSTSFTVYLESHVPGIEIYLKPGASMFGRFVDAENQQPITGVSIRIASEKSDSLYRDGDFAHETKTDTKGEFRITTPNDSGIYYAFTLIASHPQYQTHHWKMDMSPEKNVYDLGALSLKPFLSLQGKVSVSNPHHTVNGLKVKLKMHNKFTDFFRAAAKLEHTVKTDSEGNFLFSELHPIEYTLTISRNNVLIAFLDSVNPLNKQQINIHVPKLKTLQGRVVSFRERPIPDVQLYAAHRSEIRNGHGAPISITKTDANGTFQMQLLETKPHLLSVEVSKKGYLSKVYRNVKIGKDPLIVSLEKGYDIKGHVIFPQNIQSEGYYEVKVFPENTPMKPTLNPFGLIRPTVSRHFPLTQPTFILEGLLEEKYMLYIAGDGIAATKINVKSAENSKKVLIIADKPTVGLEGQVHWADTGEPVQNALVSRSWYPWELSKYDMSLTLDRFETETDAQGKFAFSNMTQESYQLNIRAVKSVFDKKAEKYHRVHIQKQITIPYCTDSIYHIYLGKADGTPFSRQSEQLNKR